jgi:uncharacterized protein YbjT (DUF2867 family)
VLGGYGLIGLEIVRRLRSSRYEIVGLGRSAGTGLRFCPGIEWIGADLATLTTPEAWRQHLKGVSAVINASGALQDGARDKLAVSQSRAICALIKACEAKGVVRFIQVSAPGADRMARTMFLRTKGEADAALRVSALEWVILKPGLVISSNAYGGTSLIRQLAAFPFIQPLVLGERRIQTVAAADVAEAVAAVLVGEVPMLRDYDLMEDTPHTLREIVAQFRRWLGFRDARMKWDLPEWIGSAIGRIADVAGWCGWRSPLRTTSLRMLRNRISGDPGPWMRATGRSCQSLEALLAALPATLQERTFARIQLTFPFLLGALSIFWIASGTIGFIRREVAARILDDVMTEPIANALVLGGTVVDVAIGVGLLFRFWTRISAFTAIIVSLGYLVAGSVVAPWLWTDPIGPYLKVLPGIALALAALMEER